MGRFSPHRDPTLGAIVDTARARGHDVVVLDIADLVRGPCRLVPTSATLCLGEGGAIELGRLDVLYLGPLPSSSARLAPSGQQLRSEAWDVLHKQQAARHVLGWSIASCAEAAGVPVLSSPTKARPFDHKPFQLAALAAAGIAVPPTIVGDRDDDDDDHDDDDDEHDHRERIVKPLLGGPVVVSSSYEPVAGVPMLWQRRLQGAHLRLAVVGGVVVAAGSMTLEEGCVDSRLSASVWAPTTVTPALGALGARCAEVCAYDVCAIDAVETVAGVVVLDVNRTPQLLDLAFECDVDIAGRCVDLLEARARR
jgi:glutathione synthase/RimK-type ligase-like ATP-grasp enzyme